jgi:hypothetical protein
MLNEERKMNKVAEVYEVASQSFSDIPLDEQILLRICDWVAVDYEGREFFGHTKNEAMNYCVNY